MTYESESDIFEFSVDSPEFEIFQSENNFENFDSQSTKSNDATSHGSSDFKIDSTNTEGEDQARIPEKKWAIVFVNLMKKYVIGNINVYCSNLKNFSACGQDSLCELDDPRLKTRFSHSAKNMVRKLTRKPRRDTPDFECIAKKTEDLRISYNDVCSLVSYLYDNVQITASDKIKICRYVMENCPGGKCKLNNSFTSFCEQNPEMSLSCAHLTKKF